MQGKTIIQIILICMPNVRPEPSVKRSSDPPGFWAMQIITIILKIIVSTIITKTKSQIKAMIGGITMKIEPLIINCGPDPLVPT